MAKGKDFSRSLGSKRLNTLIPVDDDDTSKKEIEKKSVSKPKKESATKLATTVTTFRIEDDKLLAIKAIAFWDRKKIQDVFNEALKEYLNAMDEANLQKAIAEYKKRNNIS